MGNYILFVILFLLIAANIALSVLLYFKIVNLKKSQITLNKKFAGETVEELLYKEFERQASLGQDIANIEEKIADIKNDIISLQNGQKSNFDKLNIERYNVSGEDENNLSFSIGLTNEANDGLIITGLYHRNTVNLFVKTLCNGVPDMELSDEEKKVIDRSVLNAESEDDEESEVENND